MANQRTAKPPASKAVFVNCPFDDGFKPIFRAIVFAIISSGYFPRCALDATDGAEIRISKIAEMIGECDWGIHDLSRIEVDAAGVPRFNMPMELGIHLGARLLGTARHKRKRALILEAKPHRYDAALSDISGQDIEVHANDPAEAIRRVRNWLSEHRKSKEPLFRAQPHCLAIIGRSGRRRVPSSASSVSTPSIAYRTMTSSSW